MPPITLYKRKKPVLTYNNKALHVWYNCRRWIKLRDAKRRENPLCELCLQKNPQVIRQTKDVHHKNFIDIENPNEGQIYDLDNLQSLCKECHDHIHKTDQRLKFDNRSIHKKY